MKNRLIQKYLNKLSLPKVSLVNLLVNIVCVIGVVFFAINIFNVITLGVERYNLIKGEVVKLEELKEQEVLLVADLDWYSSLDFIESQSRDFLNLANEGDSVLVVPEDMFEEPITLLSDDSSFEMVSDIKNWLDLVF